MRCRAPGPRPGSAALLGAWAAAWPEARTGTPRTETQGAGSDAPVAGVAALPADAPRIPQINSIPEQFIRLASIVLQF
jgi:hypothetical protein